MAASGMKKYRGRHEVGKEDGEPNVARAAEAQALDRVGCEDARAREAKVAATDTMTVFNIQSGYGVSKMRWRKCSSVGAATQNGLASCESSSASA